MSILLAWIALLNTDDVWHKEAGRVRLNLVKNNYIFVTTDFVLLEVADALCSPIYKNNTANFIHNVEQLNSTKVIPLDRALFQAGLNLYGTRLDKD